MSFHLYIRRVLKEKKGIIEKTAFNVWLPEGPTHMGNPLRGTTGSVNTKNTTHSKP